MVKLAVSVDTEIVSYQRISGVTVNRGNKGRHTYVVQRSLLCQIQISAYPQSLSATVADSTTKTSSEPHMVQGGS